MWQTLESGDQDQNDETSTLKEINVISNELQKQTNDMINNYDALDKTTLSQMVERKESGEWCCTFCGKISKNKQIAFTHLATHNEGQHQVCSHCEKQYKNKKQFGYPHCKHAQKRRKRR